MSWFHSEFIWKLWGCVGCDPSLQDSFTIVLMNVFLIYSICIAVLSWPLWQTQPHSWAHASVSWRHQSSIILAGMSTNICMISATKCRTHTNTCWTLACNWQEWLHSACLHSPHHRPQRPRNGSWWNGRKASKRASEQNQQLWIWLDKVIQVGYIYMLPKKSASEHWPRSFVPHRHRVWSYRDKNRKKKGPFVLQFADFTTTLTNNTIWKFDQQISTLAFHEHPPNQQRKKKQTT